VIVHFFDRNQPTDATQVPFHTLAHGLGHDPGVPVATVIDNHHVAHSGSSRRVHPFCGTLFVARRPVPSVELEGMDF
jgi:hypothetical protein